MAKKVIIIGAGLGGIALAGMLGKKGYDVTICEKNESTGGRARIWEKDGFLFDMGPSWYMMPEVFDHYFEIMGETRSDYYDIKRLAPSYRVFLKQDGKTYNFYSDPQKIAALFETLEPGAGNKLHEFLLSTKEQYEIARKEFMYKNYNSFFDFINLRTMKVGARLPIFRKQKSIIESRFKNELIRKVMQYQTILLGTAPGDTPGIYSMMNYVDFEGGVWYPTNGIRSIPESLTKIALKYGATIRNNAPVKEIVITDGQASGVLLESGETVNADIVVSNADIWHTDSKLLKEHKVYDEKYWNSRVLAPSAFILYLGVKGKISNLDHHNLLFSKDWKKNFEEIFGKDPQWPTEPSLYICMPTKTDETVAPKDCENLFVLVPIPAGMEYTEEFQNNYAQFVLSQIEQYMNIPDLRERIIVQRIYSINEFKSDYNAHKGTALGLAHTLRQTAVFRPNNVHPKISNLFYVGAGTNPGIGMPICLISAELAYKRIECIEDPFPLKSV